MILRGYFSILLFCSLHVFAVDSIEELCHSIKLEQVSCSRNQDTIETLPNELNQKSLARWQWIINKANQKKTLLQAEIDNNKGMLRYLRSDFVDSGESRKWYEDEFEGLQNDFNELKAISKEIDIASKKLNMCFRVCTPAMRVENEEHLKKLQTLKIILLSKRPILAGPQIEKIVTEDNVKLSNFKDALAETYSIYLSRAQEEVSHLNERYLPEQRQYRFAMDKSRSNEINEKRLETFFDAINGNDSIDSTTSDLLSSVDWRQEVLSEPEVACSLYQDNKEYLHSKMIKEIGIEVGMFAAPFVVGPAFRLGIWGLRGVGLAKWGMREELYANITKASAGISSAAFFTNDVISIPKLKRECEENLNDFIRTKKQINYQKYIECEQSLSSEVLLVTAQASLAGFSSLAPIKSALNLSKKFEANSRFMNVKSLDELDFYLGKKAIDNKDFGATGYKLSLEKGDYYVLNLNGDKKDIGHISNDYWNFVADTYRQRLSLTDDQIDGFIKSSRAMEDRTTLIVSTEKGNTKSMRGGLAVVSSREEAELMPFEKATGIKVKRTPGMKVAEAVRFTVDEKKGDRKLSEELLGQLITSMNADKKLESVYIYTSKKHERLYGRILKKHGIEFKHIADHDEDVILQINK